MNFADELAQTITELGPAVPEIDTIVQTDTSSWVLRFGDADLEIEADAEGLSLTLTSIVGTPAPEDRLRVYTALLHANMLMPDTGGVVMALGADGQIVQTALLSRVEPTVQFLGTVATNFLAKVRIWRTLIASPAGQEDVAIDTSLLIRI